jgi:tetratricopeptide (TPR) repeat protein
MSRKKKPRPKHKHKHASPPPREFLRRLEEADDLIRRGQWSQARPLLEELDRRYPPTKTVLLALAHVYHALKEGSLYLGVAERLHALAPGDANFALMTAEAYLVNMRPALALRAFRRFLERWPDDPRAAEARRTADEVQRKWEEVHDNEPRADLEVAALNEEMQVLLEQGKCARARELGQQLLLREPGALPVLNNLGEVCFREGRADEAVAYARRVLDTDPGNIHALSNLTRYLCLTGRLDEARQTAERLEVIQSPTGDAWIKKAEALSYLGDDQGVLDALGGAEQSSQFPEPPHDAFLYHLAAVAACRQGREDEARDYWRQALRRQPGSALAQANLDDLDLPPGEQNAPWPFSLPYWIREQTINELMAAVQRAARPGRNEGATRQVRRFLETRPDLAAVLPLMLDRGDPMGREFALRVALLAETPELLSALRDFALGRRGSDALRTRAAEAACRAGLIASGKVRMWLQGEWRETLVFGFELHGEAVVNHSPKIHNLISKGIEADNAGDGARAEQLFRQALELEPDAPDTMNNLATAIQLQGRIDEAIELTREIHRRHPDYLFARVTLARLHVQDGQVEEARAMLDPLLARRRLHFAEFAVLCMAEIDVALAGGQPEAARSWVDLWESGEPDHPGIPHFRRRVGEARREGRRF